MKIVNNQTRRYNRELSAVATGTCVEFDLQFNPRHEENAKFLLLEMPSEYIEERKRRDNDGLTKRLVANLDTGLTSLVQQTRMVRVVCATVVLSDRA